MNSRPVSFNEIHIELSSTAMERHVLEARRMRSDEFARLIGLAWRAPSALARRLAARRPAGLAAARSMPISRSMPI